jgi:hypothetical protein
MALFMQGQLFGGDMPLNTAWRLFSRVGCSITVAVLSACATKPEPRAVPLQRSLEIPVLNNVEWRPAISQGIYRYQNYSQLPDDGTRELPQPKASSNRRWKGWPDHAGSPTDHWLGALVLLPVTVIATTAAVGVVAVDAVAGGPKNRKEERESNYQKSGEFRELLTDGVVKVLNEAFVGSFKSSLGWTSPNLTAAPAAGTPALELHVSRIELLELSRGSRTLVVCATTWVLGGTQYRTFETCRQEPWETTLFSQSEDPAPFIAALTGAITRLGQATAKGVIRD